MKYHVNSQDTKNDLIREVLNLPLDGSHTVEVKKTAHKRTILQNASMHKYFQLLADELNSAGHEMVVCVMDGLNVDVPWTETTIKKVLWYTIMKKMYDKESTTELTRAEITEIYEALNRWTASEKGVHVPWPSKESMGFKQ